MQTFLASIFLLGILISASAYEQEPVGPRKDRQINEREVTYFVSLTGDDKNDGKSRNKAFRTMQKAADIVLPGETVVVTKGVYKHGFHLNKEGRDDAWITFIAEPGTEIRGSDVVKDWKHEGAGIYSTKRPKLLGHWQKPDTPLTARTEQVFVDGKLLRQITDLGMLKPNNVFYVDDDEKRLYVCLKNQENPNGHHTEVSRRTWAIAIGGAPNRNFWRDPAVSEQSKAAYIRIDGFTIRHIANFSRMAAVQIRGICHHILVENCDIQWTNFCALAAASLKIWAQEHNKWLFCDVSHVTFRNNILSNNGVQGAGGGGVSYLTVENNLIDNNNYMGMSPWSEGGAVKTGFDGSHILLRNNICRNNNNHGLWIDYGSTDCVIENNFVYNSLAGAVLDEVTPTPGTTFQSDGERIPLNPTIEEVKELKQRGTIIRNNILIRTRTPGGGGINISSSCDSEVYNNICYQNDGGAINFGGSPTRPHIQGLFRNIARNNICVENYFHATVIPDEHDSSGRTFRNVFKNNLFVSARAGSPFKIGGELCGIEAFNKYNKGAVNFFSDEKVFANPEQFDFTIVQKGLTAKAGFQPDKLRLDWSEYYAPEEKKDQKIRRTQKFIPLDLSAVYNRALVDEQASDGEGGWSDQGPNDMSKLPLGEVSFDGVEYRLGTKEKGAVLLTTDRVKGNFPEEVSVAVGRKFDSIYFLYTAAWAGEYENIDGEKVKIDKPIAKFILKYADNTRAQIPLIVGKHLYDWWTDLSWQKHANLNDNKCYMAWQGPNREVARVTVYYRDFTNPFPDKQIESIEVTKAECHPGAAFFLLGITGAKDMNKEGESDQVFFLDYNGDVDAVDSAGVDIEASGFTEMAFDAGTFEDGLQGRAFRPSKPVFYPTPADFPLEGQGTISLWLKADDWKTEERIKENRNLNYRRTMTPLEGRGAKEKYSPWTVSFQVKGDNNEKVYMIIHTCGQGETFDVSEKIEPFDWFNVCITWEKNEDGTQQRRVYLDGELLSEKSFRETLSLIGDGIYVGVPKNGGQPWQGVMDDLLICRQPMSMNEITEAIDEKKARKKNAQSQ